MIDKNLKSRLITSFILFLLILVISKSNFFLVYFLIILGVLSIIEFLNLTNKVFIFKLYKIMTNIIFIFYLSFFSFLFFYFTSIPQIKIFLFSILLTCVASDIGGFIIGKKFKGPKLSKVSPNKTISGSIGSILFSCFSFSLIIYFYTNTMHLKILFIAAMISIVCQLGDLFFSFLKRKAKVKDTGNILPGHGGVLDRIDGILFGLPFGILVIILLF